MNVSQTPGNPNLKSTATFNYKDILIRKLVYAVGASVLSHIVIFLSYIIFTNISIHPREWLISILGTFTHFSIWIFIVIFYSIIFAECLICSKDYMFIRTYYSTRFQQFSHIFSLHNFIVLFLQIITGGAFVWQILSIMNHSLTAPCDIKRFCLVEDTLFLILGGFWTGFYYYFRIYALSKYLVFSVVPQEKSLQFWGSLTQLFRNSLRLSVYPTIWFTVIYFVLGGYIEESFRSFFHMEKSGIESSFLVYILLWWFSTLYFFCMDLMKFFFQISLTQVIEFPLVKENENVLTLSEGITLDSVPIIQHLACLDLFQLSQWSPPRRELMFSLSQPGAHPHNWNALVESILKLFTDYTESLKKSAPVKVLPQTVPEPDLGVKYKHFRNMIIPREHLNYVTQAPDAPQPNYFTQLFNKMVNFLKAITGVHYFFGELPQSNIQKCLGNGQLIVWASQGISELIVCSLTEDKYGIVQKDLPVLISTLVSLQQHMDQLNKNSTFARTDFNYKMKNAVTAAVRQSLLKICIHFEQYFSHLSLEKDVKGYLQTHVMFKNHRS